MNIDRIMYRSRNDQKGWMAEFIVDGRVVMRYLGGTNLRQVVTKMNDLFFYPSSSD